MTNTEEQPLELLEHLTSPITKLADELEVSRRTIQMGDSSIPSAVLNLSQELFDIISLDNRFDIFGQNFHLLFSHLSQRVNALVKNWDANVFIEVSLDFENVASDILDTFQHLSRSPNEPRRTDLINWFVHKFGYKRYLEIGCNDNACFSVIDAPVKVGVDPVSGGTIRMTSDEYFSKHSDTFDLIFIDGLHLAEQVSKDVDNALKILNSDGTIVMHDCNPRFEIRQIVPERTGVWNGDVWKAFVELRTRKDIDCAVANFDHGCGVIRQRTNTDLVIESVSDWNVFSENKVKFLRLMSFEQIKQWA